MRIERISQACSRSSPETSTVPVLPAGSRLTHARLGYGVSFS
jgi:hypothetical protein